MTTELPYKIGVHVAHCCPKHGCKYGHDDCPVRSGEHQPEFPPDNGCEQCGWEEEEFPQIRHYEFMHRVLDFFSKNEIPEDLIYRVENDLIVFSVNCSDTFHWASADSEPVRREDMPLLEKCLSDLREIADSAICYTAELYSARKRGMRPMRRWLAATTDTEVGSVVRTRLRELFEATGPERTREDEG